MSIAEEPNKPPSQDYGAAIARFYQGSTVAGAGFRVSEHYMLSCAHVVSQCLGLGKKAEDVSATAVVAAIKDKYLEIDFPVDAGQPQRVEVVSELWRVNSEDIAVLKLANPLPSRISTINLQADSSYWKHEFAVYGFPEKRSDGTWVTGELLAEQPSTGRIQAEGTKTEGLSIRPGFSGAPIWDVKLGGVVGMTVARDKEESAKIGFMIPYQKLKPALEAIALFELLLPEADNLAPHWPSIYRLLRPEISTESYPATLEEAIVQVQNISPQGSEYRAIEQFIGYLALPELGLLIQPGLFQWLQPQVTDVNHLLDFVRKKAAQQTKLAAGLAPHLLFWIQEALNSDRYFVQAYLIPNREDYDPAAMAGVKPLKELAQLFEAEEDEKVSQDQLEQVLQVALNESMQEFQEQEEFPALQVDVFLSRRGLCWQVERWSADEKTIFNPQPEPVGARYRVVLRLVERLDQRFCTAQMKLLWKKKWAGLEHSDSLAAKCLVSGNHKQPNLLSGDLSSDQVVGWHRSHPPEPVAETDPCHFSVLIGKGAAVALWLHQALPDHEAEFAQLLNDRISELPNKVMQLRKAGHERSDQNSSHIGDHLGLIWEDPKLVPPGAIKPSRLRMSA